MLQWRVQRDASLATVSQSQKAHRSPDRSLQLDCVKSESLVIVDQNATVNTFPGLVHTARHTMGVGFATEVVSLTVKEGDYHGRVHDWGEVVTR